MNCIWSVNTGLTVICLESEAIETFSLVFTTIVWFISFSLPIKQVSNTENTHTNSDRINSKVFYIYFQLNSTVLGFTKHFTGLRVRSDEQSFLPNSLAKLHAMQSTLTIFVRL